jgi:hypothetical protein
MATRARTTFQKKQKEMARKDRQLRKAERREQRRMDRADTPRVPQDSALPNDEDRAAGRGHVPTWSRPSG